MTTSLDYRDDSIRPDDYYNGQISCGTTTLAFEFDGGVLIGADSRTTQGIYVSSPFTNKIDKITDSIYCLRSGSAADTQMLSDIVQYHISVYEMETGENAPVAVAANTFRNLCYNYRDQLTAGIIVAGYDERLGGQVYIVPLGGMLLRQPISVAGSGSTYIFGYIDSNFKEKMSKDEAIQFTVNALSLAMSRDGSSGGVARLAIITKDGVERKTVLGNELPKFYEG